MTIGLDLLVLGVGDALSAEHYSTCFVLHADDRWLLVDCPHPIRKMLREASTRAGVELDLDQIDAVALTHLHADHASGLEGLGFFSFFALGRRARIAVHPAVASRLWDGHLSGGMELLRDDRGNEARHRLEDFFEVAPLDESCPVTVGPFSIECRFTRHHVPTTALRITAGGRRIAFSADTEFDPDLIEWLGEADLVVHEVGLGVHASSRKLAALPGGLRARMRLAHFPDHLDLSDLGIEPLGEGALYAV
jgi:ribonuclease BN (tRNA processing enzyme)